MNANDNSVVMRVITSFYSTCIPRSDSFSMHRYNEYIKINESDRSQWCSKNFINYRSMLSAVNIRHQLMDLMISLNIPMKSSPVKDEALHNNNIRRCLCKGFFMQVAHREKGGYLTVKDHQVSGLCFS